MYDKKNLEAKREAVRFALNNYRASLKHALEATPRGSTDASQR